MCGSCATSSSPAIGARQHSSPMSRTASSGCGGLRVAARLATTLRAEFGPAAAARRARAFRRVLVDGWLSPLPATLAGPETLPAEAFEQRTIDALLADD